MEKEKERDVLNWNKGKWMGCYSEICSPISKFPITTE